MLLDNYLSAIGIYDYSVVPDESVPPSTVQIKTLIWSLRHHCDDGSIQERIFATATRVLDFVDESLLISLICKKYSLNSDRKDRLMLSLADKDVAEQVTGLKTGTMSPIFYGTENSIDILFDKNIMDEAQSFGRLVSVGSGMPCHSLCLSWETLLRSARFSSCDICSLSRVNSKKLDSLQDNKPKLCTTPSRKSLSKRLLDAAGRTGRWPEVKSLIDQIGPNLPSMMECGRDAHYTKNALHLAAWKGDIQSIKLLLEAGKKFNRDLINVVSTGDGNYGKTPIFYAITQDRDDIVRILIEAGSNLLIVNNKGQTPSSLSMAHLTSETRKILFDEERRQLENGGNFINYRVLSSDHRQYGDLDPRFPIDSDNWGEDIENEFRRLGIQNQLSSPDSFVYSDDFPRCVRQTTAQSRLVKATENKLKIVIRTPVVSSSDDYKPIPPSETSGIEFDQKLVSAYDDAPPLTLKDMSYLSRESHVDVILVQSYDDLIIFNTHVQTFVDETKWNLNLGPVQRSWGLDCEWKPKSSDQPVAILQLSTVSHCYIIDLQILCQASSPSSQIGSDMTESEKLLNSTLLQLFLDKELNIVGFDIMNDLERLFGSFPYIPCFTYYESVVDLHTLISKAQPSSHGRKISSSLKNVVHDMLHKNLDKTLQCSDWSNRPLSEDQIQYAALDALVLLALMEKVINGPSRTTFKSTYYVSVRFDLYDGSLPHNESIARKKGKTRQILGHRITRKSWPTMTKLDGDFRPDPTHPECASVPFNSFRQRPKPSITDKGSMISSSILPCNLNALPAVGEPIGFTKHDCIKRFISDTVSDHNYFIGFNRRSGLAQLQNAWVLFVTHPTTKYQNVLSDLVDKVDFFVNLKSAAQCRILRDVNVQSDNRKKLLLSVRFIKGSYIYCGECKCILTEIVDHQVKLKLELETGL